MDNSFNMFDDIPPELFSDLEEPSLCVPEGEMDLPMAAGDDITPEMVAIAESIDIRMTENYTPYIHSTDIAKLFNIQHKSVIRAIENIKKKDTAGEFRRLFMDMPYQDSYNRSQKGYAVTQSGLSLLALNNIQNNTEMKIAINLKFNVKFRYLKKLLYDAQQEIKRLQTQLQNQAPVQMTDEQILSQAVLISQNIITEQKKLIAQQENQITMMKPKADFADAFQGCTNNMLIGTLANRICDTLNQRGIPNKVGQKTLFEWMRKHRYLKSSTRDQNMPTKMAVEMGVLTSKYTTIQHKTIPGSWYSGTPEVTSKGVVYFTEKILKIYEEGGDISC